MLQTMSTKSQRIPQKSKLLLEFPIGLHYKNLNQNVLLKVDTGQISIVSVLELSRDSFLTNNSTGLYYC